MADSWQTIEQAAVSLRLSVRTVNRHIAAGKLQSRLTSEGRREVLVSLPDGPAGESDAEVIAAAFGTSDVASIPSAAAVETPAALSSGATYTPMPGVSVDPETVLALADNAAEKAEMAVAAYQALARVADQQAQQVRRNARFAWAAVAVMAAGITSAVGYTSYKWTRMTDETDTRLTRATADIDHLKEKVDSSIKTIDQLKTERETLQTELTTKQEALRAELADARDQRAAAEGKLAAYREQDAARQSQEAALLTAATAAAKAASAAAASAAATSRPSVALQKPASAVAASEKPRQPEASFKPPARASQASWKTVGREFRSIDASVPGLTMPLASAGRAASDEESLGLHGTAPTTRSNGAALSGKALPTTTRAPSPSDTASASTASEQQPR
jgi:hypothetical protein